MERKFTRGKKDQDKYILGYVRGTGPGGTGDYLTIHYGDGSNQVIPYTVADEVALLNTQKQQLATLKKDSDATKKKRNGFIGQTLASAFVCLMYASILATTFTVGSFIVFGAFAAIGINRGYKAYKKNKDFKTLEKYKVFIKNDTMLNNNLTTECSDKVVKPENAVNQTDRRTAGIRDLNANTIDDVSLRDVKRVLREADCDRYLYGDTNTVMNHAAQSYQLVKSKFKRRRP